MSLVVEWRHFSSGDVFDITDRINLTDAAFSVTENAEEMTVGASTLVIDDPDGDFDIPGHSYIRVTETECPDEKVIWAGFVTIRHIKRATGFLTGAARTWTGNLDDVNTVLARRILSETNDADRPAETDVERIQWLFDEGFLGVLDTYFNTANPVDMSASNLVGMTVYDAVNDCLLQSGKNAFQQDISDGMGGYINFTWYDFANSTVLESELQISNYISDITAEVGRPSPSGAAQTWYASLDTDQERDPTRIYWKIRGQYDGGTVTRTRPATAVEFAARETTASWPLVKTATQANARADRQLLDISTEEDVITTTIWVHPEHVNDARAGRKVQARFSHLPGYEDWSWMRILNRTVTLETPEVYRIQYTLSPDAPAAPPAPACSVQNPPEVAATVWTDIISGSHGNEAPFEDQPATPSAYPCVVFDGWGGGNGGTVTHATHLSDIGCGTCPTATGPSDYTEIGNIWISPLNLFCGYQALTAGAPSLFAYCTDASCDGGAFLSFALQTAATAPLQAPQQTTGASVTFDDPMTPGAMLVMYRVVQTNGTGSDDIPPTLGWTRAYTADGSAPIGGTGTGVTWGGIASGCTSVWTRCVQEGDDQTYDVGVSAFATFSIVSEWAIE